MERLQKYLSQAGIASRRMAEKMILAGKVAVNGKVITKLGTKISLKDRITVNNLPVENIKEKVYYVFNKPKDVIVTMNDTHGRQTIAEYFKNCEKGLHPVGRLDRDTMGLILVTNDGEFTNIMTHPRYHVPKKYFVRVFGAVTSEKLNNLQKGVKLSDGITSPAQIEDVQISSNYTEFFITIKEGKNRQIRRMLESVRLEVVSLMRVKVGSLTLKGLKLGQKRKLNEKEIKELKAQLKEYK